ncbi:CoA transferase [Thauera butanivorans]|uniref:CoA transferase n=1 Tax=Thauera butanivorans TaxID=86174 RepID=UPI000838173A|nr:CoA transferase [Thauera butanivorans]
MEPAPGASCREADGLLAGRSLVLAGEGCASRYAEGLLSALGARVGRQAGAQDAHPAIAWARSGLMWLTGAAEQPGCMLPAPLSACANGVLQALGALGAQLPPAWRSGEDVLAQRAALLGLRRRGRISAGGSCRLLAAADGMLAVNLARDEDWELLPAWLEGRAAADWPALAAAVAAQPAQATLERARLLGLPVAAAELPAQAPPWCRVRRGGAGAETGREGRSPRVLDLSALWAGPLCGQLLHQLGAQVVKVESTRRPDGARAGNAAFFDLLNAGKWCVAVDFASAAGIERLRRLIEWADIVIDSSRPRALRQLGIDAEAMVAAHPALSWISITGYGRHEPAANWVAFGDDAGVAGGLSTMLARAGGPWAFCGDAIGDPLTGLHAALAAWAAHAAGGGCVVSLAMRDVVAHCAAWERLESDEALRVRARRWHAQALAAGLAGCRPARPAAAARARPHGGDDAALAELLAC